MADPAVAGATDVAPAAPAAVAVESGRLYVEFKTATLFDAVQMVQQAVGRTDYEFADEAAAKATLVASNTFNNAAWDNIIRRITTDSGFKIVPQPGGKKSIEVRAPAFGEGGIGGIGGYGSGSGSYGSGSGGYGGSGGSGGGSGGSNYGSGGYPGYGSPSFQGRGQGGAPQQNGYGSGGYPGYSGPNFQGGGGAAVAGGRPGGMRQSANQQTAPGLGAAGVTAAKDYRLLKVQHVYVGGIAKLFGDGSVISTEEFLLPDSALSGNGGGFGGNGNGNGGFGGGGFGGSNSGFGGSNSGFGGSNSGFGSSNSGFGNSSGFGSSSGFGGGTGLGNSVGSGFGF